MKKNKFILSLMIIFTLIIIFVNADVVFPGWSNNVTYPNSSNPYTGFNQFNTTWNDAENLSVWIEHNFTGVLINSSELPNSSKVYYYNTGNITPGSYVWRMFANDTSGNLNVSNFSIYVVNRANSSLNLSINDSTDNLTIGIETYFLINSTVMDGDNQNITLFIDGSIINISTSIMNNYIFYSEGLKNITLVYNVSENYTASSVTYFVNITDTTLNSTLNFSDDSFFGQSSITFNITTNKWAICEFKPINITYDFAGLNHGFIHGANWTDNGSIGGAFNFDGVDDYISLKSDFSSSVAETFTLMFWFKTNNTDEQQSLVDFGRDTYGSGWRTFVSSDLLYFTLNNNTDDDLHELILTTPFTETNIWKHVTIIYNTSGSYLYINGVYNTSDDYVNSAVWRYNEYLTIGSLAFSQGNYFLLNGSIDEIKIYNRALSANEISND